MALSIHPAIHRDVKDAGRYYLEISERLEAEFFDRLYEALDRNAENPRRHHFITPRHRRANLKQFPYHILYEEQLDGSARILVVRHDKRHPSFGLRRQ